MRWWEVEFQLHLHLSERSAIHVGCPVGTSSDFGCNAYLALGQDPYAGPHNQTNGSIRRLLCNSGSNADRTDELCATGGKAYQLRGPTLKNLDASLLKRFAVTEKNQMEFRAEGFNVSNAVDFSNPGQLNFTNLKAFSSITGTRNNQRLMQLALKLFF